MFRRLSLVFASLVPVTLYAAEPEPAPATTTPAPATQVEPAPAPAPAPMPAPAPAPVAAPPPPPSFGFDVVQSPWGPGRKSSGEGFKSAATLAKEGPARWRWQDYSLAIGGQYFARGELRDGEDFNATAGDQTLGIEHRARLTIRASAKDRLGVYLEFQDVRGWGSEPNTVTVTPNTGLHQGFLDFKATSFLDIRIGRQELAYGEDRLIGNLDWAQSGRAFDGIFARVTASPSVTIDAFTMMLKPPAWLVPDASTGRSRFHNSGNYFGGIYARGRMGKFGLDIYGLGLFEDPATAAMTTGLYDNNRITLGGRAMAGVGGLAAVIEGAYQLGKQGLNNISAGAFAAKATYTFSSVWGAPYIMGEFSCASGDGNGMDTNEGTFNQLFPTAHVHLGYMDYVAWQNVVHGRGTVGIRPWGAHLWVDVHHFRAWDPKGAWYRANGAIFLAADPNRTSGNMGTEVDVSLTVPIVENFSVAGNFSVFMPGMEALAKGTAASTWGFLSIRSQF